MQNDLISRSALKETFEAAGFGDHSLIESVLAAGVYAGIENAPTIDAVPVVHGRVVWKNRFMGGFVHDITITDRAGEKHTGTLDTTHYEPVPYCSVCGKELGVSSLAYCPNCGAKMDGGAADA